MHQQASNITLLCYWKSVFLDNWCYDFRCPRNHRHEKPSQVVPACSNIVCSCQKHTLNHEAQVDGNHKQNRGSREIIWYCAKKHIHSARNSSRIFLFSGASRTSTASRTAPDKSLSSQLRMIKFNAKRQNAQILHSICTASIYSHEYHAAHGRG